jgi:hypothetical protein
LLRYWRELVPHGDELLRDRGEFLLYRGQLLRDRGEFLLGCRGLLLDRDSWIWREGNCLDTTGHSAAPQLRTGGAHDSARNLNNWSDRPGSRDGAATSSGRTR